MGAAFGVTRPVVMNAWAPPDRQIGVSGTRTAPAVCVVVGASGAPAFLWGVERAGFIAAVDTDERAAIAGEADAVVVDDAVAVIEALADIVAPSARPESPGVTPAQGADAMVLVSGGVTWVGAIVGWRHAVAEAQSRRTGEGARQAADADSRPLRTIRASSGISRKNVHFCA